MNMRPLTLTLLLALALTGPAGAVEQSARGSSANGVFSNLQINNDVLLAVTTAAINKLKIELAAIMDCQNQQLFWNGSGCFGYSLLSYTELPMQIIQPNRATPWQQASMVETDGGSGIFGTKGSCNYYIYHRECDCTPDSLNTSVVISGTQVIIGPVQCNSYMQQTSVPCDGTGNPGAYGPSRC